MGKNYYILIAAWTLFSVLHSVTAGRGCKAYFQKVMGQYFRYYRLLYSLFALVTLGGCVAWQLTIPVRFITTFPILKFAVGYPGIVSGMILMAVCIHKYFYKLSGVGHLLKPSEGPVLERTGVHKLVRHPLYLGTVILIWSLFLFFPSLSNLITCLAVFSYVLVGAFIEERKLEQVFGSEYKLYRQNTPMLIPGFPLLKFRRRAVCLHCP